MTFANDDEWNAFIGRDDWLPIVTAETVAGALDQFAIPLPANRSYDWLAMAVRRSLSICIPIAKDSPSRTSNLDLRAEIERRASLVEHSRTEVFKRHDEIDSLLWEHSFKYWNGEGGTYVRNGLIAGQPSDFQRYKAIASELDWLASFIRAAGESIPKQHGPWRQVERKKIRVERARYLALVFEATYCRAVTSNNYPNDPRHKTPTPFMDFYLRMVTLAFDEQECSNFTEVVKEACQSHRQQPAQIDPNLIPGLPQ